MSVEEVTMDLTNKTTPDDLPPDSDLSCLVCGEPLTYSGRGRKPKYCAEHKPVRGTATPGPRARSSAASVDGALATLGTMYDAVAALLMLVGLPQSASVWAGSIERLQRTNEAVLRNDPALVKAINKTGEVSGKAMFIGSHLATIAPVVMIARAELAEKKPRTRTPKARPNSPVMPEQEHVEPSFGNENFF